MDVINTIHKALSDKDIKEILGGKCKVIKYSELAQCNTLSDLVPDFSRLCGDAIRRSI